MKRQIGKMFGLWWYMRKTCTLLLITALFSFAIDLNATHIVGGEFYYDCLGNNQYRITLKVYRDCYLGQAQLDNPAQIGIYDGNRNLIGSDQLYAPAITNIPVVLDNPCLVAPPNVCVQEGIYQKIITLPPNSSGYYIAYQRCCRNNSIQNLALPGDQGATYVTFIPDSLSAPCNSSPRFNDFPPVAICADEPLSFDHSATDPDGDSLVYKLCPTFQGASSANPAPTVPGAPPYSLISYASGYSHSNPLPGSPGLSINSSTGLLTGTPSVMGQYVVGVCVEEYRNGILIGTHFRDFQFNVANCNKQVSAAIPVPIPGDSAIRECSGFEISFGNNSNGATSYFWDFGVSSQTNDTSRSQYPTFIYPDTGTYQVMLIANPGLPCTDTDYVEVKVYPFLEADFLSYDLCENTLLSFSDNSTSEIGTLVSWNWNFGDGGGSNDQNPEHIYNASGTYPVNLIVKNSIGCSAQIQKDVIVYPTPQADFEFDGGCIFKITNFIDRSTVGSGSISRWEWRDANGILLDTTQNSSFTFTTAGTHPITLIVHSSNGCTDTITKVLDIDNQLTAEAWGDTTICYGESTQLFGTGGHTFFWESTDGLFNSTNQNPFVSPQKTTTYIFRGSDDCYFDTAHVTVNVLPAPDLLARDDTSIFHGQSVRIFATSNAGLSFLWNPSNGLGDSTATSLVVSPTETTTYSVTTMDINGCTTTEEIIIYVRPICDKLFIPSAFSPNGDGRNDYFKPIDYGQNALEEMRIYNRWGDLIYRSSSFEAGWDGTFKGREQNIGSYVYIIEGTCERTPVRYQGNVTLIR